MKLKPVITEKTNLLAKDGIYTFYVDPRFNKREIRDAINETFDVHVVKIRTMNKVKGIKKNYSGRKTVVKAVKKAIVVLREKEKISVFETKGGKK
ncbi:50S ribosomal protein L23 [Candidatus Woesebacteria bacterium RBG_16_36_11]|uniref:50S ribosomal protein L23 n=3 Tax=Candidatus Woeseibacteriota TaxID=1752722 RepID=A0A1F7XD53_9BACT|nr:MAG: 50S ribosomal protein L23 [Candidatus Woesebacteria bacterium RBG_13_36_22]OGM12338.1 MAG: 50S ribosomal protein L23 [Candidatus Woesebacteria bacterium RBG_16_36_11]OGM17243.1 MAG: 50S ribosomal protein L23 [Candidatus Woesebacteria bacterium RBG_19FT_COMBO_37_29]